MKSILAVVLACGALAGAGASAGTVHQVGTDTTVAADASNKMQAAAPAARQAIDALLAGAVTDPKGPGMALAVYQHGRLVYAKAAGLANLETGTPITPQTIFHVASVSKQFTAFAIALLAREGKVDLDADVRTYLSYMPDFGTPITVRNLLQHTSGLRDQWMLLTLAGLDTRNVISQQHLINMVAHQRGLNFTPGTRYQYSNTGYTLLAEIVKQVSGKSLRQFTSERIFQPLGMTRTIFYDDVTEVVPGRAQSYYRRGDRWTRALLNFDNAGATSLFTTVEDLAKWAGNFAHPKVGDVRLIEQITTSGKLKDGSVINYGFGLRTNQQYAGHRAVMHFGSDAGFRSGFVYVPEQDFAVLLTANTPPADQLRLMQKVVDVYLNPAGSRLPQPQAEIKLDAAAVAAATGAYRSRYGRLTWLVPHSTGLALRTLFSETPLTFRADGTFELTPRNWNYYRAFRLLRGKDGPVTGVEVIEPSMHEVETLQRVEPVKPSTADLAALTGDYRSAELDVTYTLTLERGALVARAMRIEEPMVFTPATRDRFDSRLAVIEFVRDAHGHANGFKLHSTGVNDVQFDRSSSGCLDP